MSGPKRNPDSLNTIGIVVVGICGAVLIYVTIVALQAFYMNDTSEIQTMADYGGNDTSARSIKTAQIHNITDVGANAVAAPKPGETPKTPTYHVNIDDAMKLVVESAKVDPSTLVPTQGRADKATIKPIFGRPQPIAPAPTPTPTPTDGAGSGSAAPAPAAGTGAGAVPAAGTGSAAPATAPAATPEKTRAPAPAAGSAAAPAAGPAAAGSAAKGNGP